MDTINKRTLLNTTYRDDKFIFLEEKKLLNFSSNDYLNLGANTDLKKEFLLKMYDNPEAIFSSASSRLLSGNSSPFTRLEKFLAYWYQKEKALLFNSGYQANMGIISALMQKNDVIFSDKLNHNSILAGIQHSQAKFYRYKHLDYNHLEDLLKKNRQNHKKALLVSESVFSMDGDLANIENLIFLKEKYSCLLMIDEAHAIGVLGNKAQGLSYTQNHTSQIDIIMASLGKALGSAGAFCVANNEIIDQLINNAQTFIFSTALSPIQILWTEFLLTEKFPHILAQQQKLKDLIHHCQNIDIPFSCSFDSHIIPLILGETKECVKMAEYLQAKGFFVLPIRPPTVPQNTARLRLSLSSNIQYSDLLNLFNTIKEYPYAI